MGYYTCNSPSGMEKSDMEKSDSLRDEKVSADGPCPLPDTCTKLNNIGTVFSDRASNYL